MKRLILLLLSVFAVTATQAQQKVTLKQCQGDTVAYLKTNFEQGKARFVGQPFSKVIDEWRAQIPVAKITFSNTGNWPTKESEKYLVTGAYLDFITEREQNLRDMRKEPYISMSIQFAPPFYKKINDYWQLQEQEDTQLGSQLYEQIKDYIVESIAVVEMK